MNVIAMLHHRLERHLPLLVAVTATAWTLFGCAWSLYAFAHPLG
jgi:hypothetical protein